mmetsp:Transcript_15652/g.38555  ORF Transcript_15652/g.38555 Transcript_15652/m.38555 type:complete len:100 (+) Transcript_15652:87-386(+)|eukprot:CAMPEP_0113614910 /NCGR_PEP_ID=MMETSP0017_2-20120614/7419_1 /TAXON_ID=2856 /ORGANISM="Cylindrotheca closterium" /LENGTH=99 /DNA_ID=CAMNT_0000524111 /DNA_START=86 /DNA_END=385 /DNA_ORIENTATION=- /assembly_acc=CAM_ASM_000147
MKSFFLLATLFATALLSVSGFAPVANTVQTTRTNNVLNMAAFDGESERPALTRDTEPEEFFSTNTDKMSDEEKIPIALMGLAGVSLPFILGLIALYSAK